MLVLGGLLLAVLPVMLVWTSIWGSGPPLTSADIGTNVVLVAAIGGLSIWGLWSGTALRRYRFVLSREGFFVGPRGSRAPLVPWTAVARVRLRLFAQGLDLYGVDGHRLGRLLLAVTNPIDAVERVLARVPVTKAVLPATFARGRLTRVLLTVGFGFCLMLGVLGVKAGMWLVGGIFVAFTIAGWLWDRWT